MFNFAMPMQLAERNIFRNQKQSNLRRRRSSTRTRSSTHVLAWSSVAIVPCRGARRRCWRASRGVPYLGGGFVEGRQRAVRPLRYSLHLLFHRRRKKWMARGEGEGEGVQAPCISKKEGPAARCVTHASRGTGKARSEGRSAGAMYF